MQLFHKRYHRPGTSPGTMAGDRADRHTPPTIWLADYDPASVQIVENADLAQCRAALDRPTMTWIHVQGDVERDKLAFLADAYGLNPLATEDVLNVGQRAKVDFYGDQLFAVLALPSRVDGHLSLNQVSLFLGDGYAISFCTGPADVFAPVRQRLNAGQGSRLRRLGVDYLFYALIDTVIDHGFPLMEDYATRIEQIEAEVLEAAGGDVLADLHQLKRELIFVRRVMLTQREMVGSLLRQDTDLIDDTIEPYLRDCHDHCLAVIDFAENYRELATSIMEVHLTSISNRMNDVMKVLTIIATIFIPLSFVAGVYGMNFDPSASPWNMPELAARFGYPAVLAVMALLAAGMLWMFRRRGWF